MEDQTHITLGQKRRKNEPIVSLHKKSDKQNIKIKQLVRETRKKKKKTEERKKRKHQKQTNKQTTKKTKQKQKQKTKRKKKMKTTYSLPSLRERSETPGALGRRDWESQEANPLPRTVLSASVRITSYQRSGCRRGRQETIYVRSGLTPNSIIGEANFQNPSLQPNRPPLLPAKTVFKFNI